MKNLIGVIILAALCIGLGVVLFTSKKQATEEKIAATNTILSLSNEVVKTSSYLTEQQQVNTMLTNDLSVARAEFFKADQQIHGCHHHPQQDRGILESQPERRGRT